MVKLTFDFITDLKFEIINTFNKAIPQFSCRI